MHPMQYGHFRLPMPGGFRFPYPNPQMAAYMQQQMSQPQQQHAGGEYPNYQSPGMMYRMHPMMAQQQYMQQMNASLTMPPKSNASSQQPSPSGSNKSYNANSTNLNSSSLQMPYSATFPTTAHTNLINGNFLK